MEDTLVHELLHIHLHDCQIRRNPDAEPKSAETVAAERAIEAITLGLIRLSRDQDRFAS